MSMAAEVLTSPMEDPFVSLQCIHTCAHCVHFLSTTASQEKEKWVELAPGKIFADDIVFASVLRGDQAILNKQPA